MSRKSYHDAGGLPEDIKFKPVEPQKALFKDEVRKIGKMCGLPESIIWCRAVPWTGFGHLSARQSNWGQS
ncbi:hypothetical protein HMPREF0083_02932 [Aneurinibacillus aneurinilyticus ATCC 12856]|uniref:GMPS ATP-PPase domain-containing protein n=1 Tax=Aneurinibacillus aneurinilyticus ATCC 12856 TaxID=649747 RepID=U1YDW9_ANEAE|nr:hypothetical protein HMPREF0083_02932 [Aneurinibacillus aneurinilyticus ATCC 12856]